MGTKRVGKKSIQSAVQHAAAKRIQAFMKSKTRSFNRSAVAPHQAGGPPNLAVTRQRKGTAYPLRFGKSLLCGSYLPDMYETTVSMSLSWYVPAGSMVYSTGNYFNIQVNSFYQPFNTTYPVTAAAAGPGGGGTLVQGGALTNNPMGWAELAAIWQFYKVMKYRIEITAYISSTADSFKLVLIPLGGTEIPSASAGNINLRVLDAQPQTRSTVVEFGTGASDNTVAMESAVYKDLGVSREQYISGNQIPVGTSPSATNTWQTDYIGVFMQQLNGANNSGIITFSAKLIQDVRFEGLQNVVA